MSKSFLIQNGTIVDPRKNSTFAGELRIEDKRITEVAEKLAPRSKDTIIDASGKLVMPGLVDIHVHISEFPDGHQMLAKAGVTTALDVAGTPDEMIAGLASSGAGLSIGYLYPLIPGKATKGNDPSRTELEHIIELALKKGALGVKILGGHFPLTPEATQCAIELAREKRAWIAVHAGSTRTPSDICGLEELVRLAGTNPVHIAHVNSFCRGTVDTPLKEAVRAIDALKSVPNCRSESYLAMINGTSGELETDGRPKSGVTKRSLTQGGFSSDADGMKKAIGTGWARVHFHDSKKREIILLEPKPGLEYYLEKGTRVMLSFPVNSPISAIPLAIAKNDNGEFIVNALATDGGAIPRNITLKQGLCLVAYGALTLNEFARKASLIPASLMGLENKGHLSPGADADIIIVEQQSARLELSLAGGKIIVNTGEVCGSKGCFACSEKGNTFLNQNGLTPISVAPQWLNT